MFNKRNIKHLSFLLSLLFFQTALAQSDDLTQRHCATHQYNQRFLSKQPAQHNFDHNKNENESAPLPQKILGIGDSILTIPVVIHVVYYTNAENVADQQIQSQIDVLNEDYSGTNLDIVNVPDAFKNVKAGDVGVRFCLATLDPDNQPTNGIVRTKTTVDKFFLFDDVKSSSTGGDDAWPADKYLNIWVCNLEGSLLGYAQYPGTGPDSTDGVVIFYKAFGRGGTASKPYNKGRTLTHEVGHWLYLFHTWGDDGTDCNGSDDIGDTPNQAGNNFGCPSYPSITCNNGPEGDMFMNYLDYSDDSCMYMFTKGQKNRMWHTIDSLRYSLKTSMQTDCSPLDPDPDYTTIILPNPNNGNFSIRFKKTIPENFTLNIYDLLGHLVSTQTVAGLDTTIQTGIQNRNITVQGPNLANGLYFIQTTVDGNSYTNKMVLQNY